MNELKKSHINHLVAQYNEGKDEAQLGPIYRSLLAEYQSKLDYWASTTLMAGSHEIQELFDDVFMKSLEVIGNNGGDFVKLFHLSLGNRYKDLLRKLITRRKYELYETDNGDDDSAKVEIASEFNLEEHVSQKLTAKQKDDQRQLIDFLVRGENERTTAIVQSFLNHPKPTATAIAKELGLDHKQVSRALKSLAGKFSTKQFGDYTDYLIAL
ncbi:sigma-70 family RNA polymerase sigma factor [Neobacillus sp. DY30]|uniref:sigma-70 family RNA polymerase sigma factor n=1 Tax=Neobacillus sp. DY30 TaxID=3047871 RepID=UPI0024BF9F30|nr:sigma-70 family RNA polymerase sigma factor [Neobacillus sp. DY30]WHY01825.1 sigma-70 family RNA polymerase sigma factor [Neobacillus sp. DY30]